jgi:hypothetical protein
MMNQHDPEFRLMSEAVQAWYRFYKVSADDQASRVLCSAAVDLYNEGYLTAGDIATVLIETYAGISSTSAKPPASASLH